MADALISLLIETLGSMAFEKIKEEVGLLTGVGEEVERLKNTLLNIQAVLENAEKTQLITDATVRNWLDRLKDVSLDIDDVLDEWMIPSFLTSSMEEASAGGRRSVSFKKKVWLSLLPLCIRPAMAVGQVEKRHRIAEEIKELNDTLDAVATAKDRYKLKKADRVDNKLAAPVKHKITTYLINEKRVHGREKETVSLVDKLLEDRRDHEGRGFGVVSIVGIGGLGKTTLAQLVYNNDRLKGRFDVKIWVCVSDPFDEIKIAKAILTGLNGNVRDSDELNDLVQRIHKLVEGKRFFLVLDNVWNERYDRWEELEKSLGNGAAGSKILVTTRHKKVAITMKVAKRDIITLGNLSEENCWKIFSQRAFYDRTEEEYRELKDFGGKIAQKSKGLPLIATALGDLMSFKDTVEEWKTVLISELWQLKADLEIFAPFLLSYYDLVPSEKRCLLYCSIFPKDYVIRKDRLVHMWMSQGLLGCSVNLEEEGEACFKSLARRSFFLDLEKDEFDGSIVSCKMHNIVYNFIKFLTKNEYCVIEEIDDANREDNPLNERLRHLTIDVGAGIELLDAKKYNEEDKTKLRTLFLGSEVSLEDQDSLFLHQKRIRTLIFSRGTTELKYIGKLMHLRYLELSPLALCMELPNSICDLYNLQTLNLCGVTCKKLPENIGKLVNLRYLDLTSCGIVELPESICNLSKLQKLRLDSCRELNLLPEDFGRLFQLKHLNLSGCDSLVGLPKGITSLTRLETLKLVLRLNKDDSPYLNIGDLKALHYVLKSQRYLALYGCTNVQGASEAREIGVGKMEFLADLSLGFKNYKEREGREGIEDHESYILEALKPSPNLKSLLIEDYAGLDVSPKWMMSLVNLTSLELKRCTGCRFLPPLGKLPSLKKLLIEGFQMLEKIGPEFTGFENDDGGERFVSFPSLELLAFSGLDWWASWEGVKSAVMMPCLISLHLEFCDSLTELPNFLPWTTMKYLAIDYCKFLVPQCRNASGTEWTKIRHIPKIRLSDEEED